MAKKRVPKGSDDRTTCGKCYRKIDINALLSNLRKGLRYEHECGRVLVQGERRIEDV